LEQYARSQGYGSGNWETRLTNFVFEIVKLHKPLAYILGSQPFHPLSVDLIVKPPILVPRPETEHWVLHLSQTIVSSLDTTTPSDTDSNNKFRILDIGTGSGCIALGLTQSLLNASTTTTKNPSSTSRLNDIETIAIDQSELAVELAKENVQRCQLERFVAVHQLDLFSGSFVEDVQRRLKDDVEVSEGTREGQGFDLIVSNPPYITKREFKELDLSVKNWEDRKALVGEIDDKLVISTTSTSEERGQEVFEVDDGLIFYRRITSILDQLLHRPHREKKTERERMNSIPSVAFEVGKGQAQQVGKMLRTRGYKSEIVSDPWGVERAVFGWRP